MCPRYAAAVADVKVGPSPPWLAMRLHAADIRPINNVVDVTNYVLIETGQPMHAFDLNRLAGPALTIRLARPGERLTTLDGETRVLDERTLVIADASVPQAIGGVMGGARSEVGAGTRRVVFESAYFTPSTVRRTSRRLGLRTEAATRFERGANIAAPVWALERAQSLLERIGAGVPRPGVIDRYPQPRSPAVMTLRAAAIARLLGQRIDSPRVVEILERLGFGVTRLAAASVEGEAWRVVAPSWRVDMGREVDLIEEIGRHYGYHLLPTTFPALDRPAPPLDLRLEQDRLVRRLLGAAGFSEAITFAFVDRPAALLFGPEQDLSPWRTPCRRSSPFCGPWSSPASWMRWATIAGASGVTSASTRSGADSQGRRARVAPSHSPGLERPRPNTGAAQRVPSTSST